MARKAQPKAVPLFYPSDDLFELLLSFTILGEPGRKSNQRRIVRNRATGAPMIIKSQKAMDYQAAFEAQVTPELAQGLGSKDDPLFMWAHVYYASNRPDLSSELVKDILQKTGVVSNDRWIKGELLFGSVDKENPRTELRLYRLK